MEAKMIQIMHKYIFFAIFLIPLFLMSCEEDFTPDSTKSEPTYVVEGFIEHGDDARFTYVTLSKTYPLFQGKGENIPLEYYIGGADVTVNYENEEVQLTEICTQSLTEEQKALVKGLLGVDSISSDIDLCFYVDFARQIKAMPGNSYDLQVSIDGKNITATTTIPEFVPLDSIKFKEEGIENYGTLRLFLTDPQENNYYRIKANIKNGAYNTRFNSVSDDLFFNGQTFDFPIGKPRDPNDANPDPNTIGLYTVGDTVNLEWSTIDFDHFEFWNTLEFAKRNQGPFSTYTRAKSNIDGGIGIWGGLNTKSYVHIVE